jgi:hypothetical protein
MISGDHGHGFNDWGHNYFGTWENPMESGFRIPFMVYSPALLPYGPIDGTYLNLDIIPTVMDVLVSSSHANLNHTSKNDTPVTFNENLLSLNHDTRSKLQTILNRYEGTSIFRPPKDPYLPPRLTFHLDNPGNSHINAVQYPMKLVHYTTVDHTYLYDLSHDPSESYDLLSIPSSRGGSSPPEWLDWDEEDISREFNLDWWIGRDLAGSNGRTPPCRNFTTNFVIPGTGDEQLNLRDAFDWAEDAFEILLGWSWGNQIRFLTGNVEVDFNKSARVEKFRDSGTHDEENHRDVDETEDS